MEIIILIIMASALWSLTSSLSAIEHNVHAIAVLLDERPEEPNS